MSDNEIEELYKFRRTVHSELPLLEAGLIALKKGKTHITEDHLERAIYNLKRCYHK